MPQRSADHGSATDAALRVSNAYCRLLVAIERLEWQDAILPAEAAVLREAADARLFGDEDENGLRADAEIVFDLLAERDEVLPLEVSTLRERLADIEPPPRASLLRAG
jgi:hypothetical protein